MAFPFAMNLSDLPQVTIAIFIAVSVVITWCTMYVRDWLYKLEAGTRSAAGEGYLEDPSSLKRVPLPSIFNPAEKYLSIILPAYDEEVRLPATLDEALSYLEQRRGRDASFTYEILIVDDGSRDGTVLKSFEYVRKYGVDAVRVIKQGVNQGKGAAVRKGMLCSRGELLLFADSDGATKITELEKLEAEIKLIGLEQRQQRAETLSSISSSGSGSAEVANDSVGTSVGAAFGSRAHLEKEALAKRKWYRNILMFGFHFCVLLVAGHGVRDTQCGFKMFTREAARQLFPNQRLTRWCFDVELVALCRRLRIPVKELSVNWTEIPGSKIKFTSILHMLLELAFVKLGYGLNIWKVHCISPSTHFQE
eukprot:TRINITY_DN4135_c0_g1_i2.p1 TRINITY_DN4135_c0_g1~~TRINITY_DN4135_c0_g1_i2.p1  ORF type:complete len:364 (+),score=63.98 TRINITY_DN4135_c0_g1_i2:405-1496(+)